MDEGKKAKIQEAVHRIQMARESNGGRLSETLLQEIAKKVPYLKGLRNTLSLVDPGTNRGRILEPEPRNSPLQLSTGGQESWEENPLAEAIKEPFHQTAERSSYEQHVKAIRRMANKALAHMPAVQYGRTAAAEQKIASEKDEGKTSEPVEEDSSVFKTNVKPDVKPNHQSKLWEE